jgi:hypothetical protein
MTAASFPADSPTIFITWLGPWQPVSLYNCNEASMWWKETFLEQQHFTDTWCNYLCKSDSNTHINGISFLLQSVKGHTGRRSISWYLPGPLFLPALYVSVMSGGHRYRRQWAKSVGLFTDLQPSYRPIAQYQFDTLSQIPRSLFYKWGQRNFSVKNEWV